MERVRLGTGAIPPVLCLLLSLLVSTNSAFATERDAKAEALALKAHFAVQEYCADAAADDVTLAAESVAAVSQVWARLSAYLETNRKVYLLYWRGVLGQCLDQEERALTDLKTFIAARSEAGMWENLLKDAERRVRRLETKVSGPRSVSAGPAPALVISGITVGGAAGILGGLAGWQWGVAERNRQDLYDGLHIGLGDLQDRLNEEAAAVSSHRALMVATSIAGATAVGLLIAGAAHGSDSPRVAIVPWLTPVHGGQGTFGMTVFGGW